MPPSLATLLTVSFILILLWRHERTQGPFSPALWIPVLWMGITGTRSISQWMDLGAGYGIDAAEMQGGNPLDAAYFLVLILVGIAVLARRRLALGKLFRNNTWLVLSVAYAFVAITWSDFPFVSMKRWIKTLGHPVMALLIITDPLPQAALRTVFKRIAFITMPLSVLFIKYLPHLGRGFDVWTGKGYNNGVSLNKNELGYNCMLFGLFFAWNLITSRRLTSASMRREELALSIMFLCMIGWLLTKAASSTSLATFAIGLFTMLALGLGPIRKRFTLTVIGAVVTGAIAEFAFDAYAVVLRMLGRDPTLTDRTQVWADAIALVDNPILGAGFESFWLGPRLQTLWATWWWRPTQAHNGYIEIYLNLGFTGLLFLLAVICATFFKATRQLDHDPDYARLRLSYLMAILFYNYTEATFVGVSLVWTVFFIIALDYPARRPARVRARRQAVRPARAAGGRTA